MAFNPQNLQRLTQQAGSKNQQLGTGYTNLNRIMEANKGNQLGQQVAGNLQGQVSGIQTQLGEQQKQFQTEADKNKVGTEQDKTQRDAVIGRFAPSSTQAGTPLSDQETQQFGRFTSGQYAGPKGLQDTSNLQTQAGQLKQQTSNLSPSGTQELLRRTVNASKYSQGQQGLDAMLMDRSKLTPIQRQAASLGGNINRADLAASGQAELNKNLAQKFADETKAQLGAGMSGIDTSVQAELAKAQAAERGRLANVDAIRKFQQDATSRGGADQFSQIDALQNLLKSQGANTEELSKVFGTSGATQSKQERQQQQSAIEREKQGTLIGDLLEGRPARGVPDQFTKTITLDGKDKKVIDSSKIIQGIKSGEIDPNTLMSLTAGSDRLSGNYTVADKLRWEQDPNQVGTTRAQLYKSFADKQAESDAAMYARLGAAGQALKAGSPEQFYKDISTRLANAQGAQNLTSQGVASEAQRANYEALNKLMGKQASESKYRTDETGLTDELGRPITKSTKYQAGKYSLV